MKMLLINELLAHARQGLRPDLMLKNDHSSLF
jgi:hypothetical protein